MLGYTRGIGETRRPRNWLFCLSVSLKRCFLSVLYLATFLIRLTALYRGHHCERARHLLAAFFFEESRGLEDEVTSLTRESSVEKLEHMLKEILVPLVNELHESAHAACGSLFSTLLAYSFRVCLTGEGRTDTGFRRPLAHELCSHIAFWDQFAQITKLWIVLQCSSKSVADNNDLHDLQLLCAVKKFTAKCVIHLNTTGSQDPANLSGLNTVHHVCRYRQNADRI